MPDPSLPDDVKVLESFYGGRGGSVIGSAVYYEPNADAVESLSEQSLVKYEQFNGANWSRFGESAWLSTWGELYHRVHTSGPGIVAELKSLSEPTISSVVSMFLDGITEPAEAVRALSASFDRSDVAELRVFRIGDGGAISGLLIASRRSTGDSLYLVFQYD